MTAVTNPGRTCTSCTATEQTCARNSGCCTTCTHWTDYDIDGNPIPPPQGRPPRPKTATTISTLNVIVHPTRRAAINRALNELARQKATG